MGYVASHFICPYPKDAPLWGAALPIAAIAPQDALVEGSLGTLSGKRARTPKICHESTFER